MRGTQATTLLFSEEQGSLSSFTPDSIETMEMLFILLGFPFFVKGCTGLTLYGEVGGTVVFQCNSTRGDVQSLYLQGGKDFRKVISAYHKTKNLTGPSRPDTYLNHVDKTVTFRNLTVSDEGTYKCIISHGDPGGITEDTTITLIITEPPPTPSIETQPLCNVTCTLKCTADTTDLGPVSYEWKKDEGEWTKGDKLKNISSSDTPEKFFCRLKTRVRTSNTSLPMENPLYKPVPATPDAVTLERHNPQSTGDVSNASGDVSNASGDVSNASGDVSNASDLLYLLLLIVPVLVCVGGFACWKKCKGNPLSNEQRPQSAPQADPVSASEEVAEREIFVPQPPVAEDLEMKTLNNTNSNENM
ncbi:uncharacterized protein LOC130380352 isoform X2 [Gadus chalcogrammus]|uniref:uncharacterized protein LOC130380352 isoform X2 n=1 Tax=Gadus chalcogrammus TaxID=1042646 RepID=UPI0024C22A2D|nr:uncharacterized protein LOC130380352 isoform X2 [Gadus chalcogrammus]